jgi:two-component system, chemotaxis family, protein-glutamate methylesterase/glutaminase
MPTGNIVLIGASTGGLKTLEELLPRLPVLSAAIIIVQHITPFIDQSFAACLARVTRMPVSLASEGQALQPGQIHLAPGGQHLTLVRNRTLHLHQGEKVNSVRPSIDVAMQSVLPAGAARIAGVVLTGMGRDGAEGISHIKQIGGITIAQDQTTSVLYGMPKAAAATGHVDFVLPTERIAAKLRELFT